MEALAGKTPVLYTNDEWYKVDPPTVNHGGVVGIVGAGDGVADVRYLTQMHFPRVIDNPAGFDAANCVVQNMQMKSFQPGLYGDESVAY